MGSRTVASNATAIVRPDAGRPRNVEAPTLSGTAAQGQTLRVSVGTWNGLQPITFTFNWLRCDTAGNNCVQQPDSTTTRTSSVRATSARRSARASTREQPRRREPADGAEPGRPGRRPAGRDHTAERREVDPGVERPVERAARGRAGDVLAEPLRSRTEPITVRIKVKDARLRRPRRARVLRSTPLVTRTRRTSGRVRTAGSS